MALSHELANRADRRPPEGRRRHAREEAPARLRPQDDLPALVRSSLRGGVDLPAQLGRVEPEGVALPIEVEDEPRALLDRVRVQPAPEELAAVHAAAEELGDLPAEQLDAVEVRRRPVELLGRDAAAVRKLERDVLPIRGHDELELDDLLAREGRGVRDDRRPARRGRGGAGQRFAGEVAPERFRLGVASEHLRRHLVRRAAADRVVRRVLDHLSPRELEELVRPVRAVQRGERLRVALEPALRSCRCGLQVDPRGRDVHEQVRASPRPQLTCPRRSGTVPGLCPGPGRAWRVEFGRRPRRSRARRARPAPGCGSWWSVPYIASTSSSPKNGRIASTSSCSAAAKRSGIASTPAALPYPAGRYSAHTVDPSIPRHSKRWPPATAARHATPDDGVVEPERAQDLRHLRDVAEHVGQIADAHRSAELVCAREAALEVPPDRLPGNEELVHQYLPRADREPPLLDQPADPTLVLGAHLEVVVDRLELAVEREDETRVRLEHVEDAIDQPDESQPEALEREVPLPVPVRVRDEPDYLTDPASSPWTK